MCKVLNVSKSSYYRWFKEPVGKRKQNYMGHDNMIKLTYFTAKGWNGSPCLAINLLGCETFVFWTTVTSHKKQMGLRSKFSKRYKVTTNSSHNFEIAQTFLTGLLYMTNPLRPACLIWQISLIWMDFISDLCFESSWS